MVMYFNPLRVLKPDGWAAWGYLRVLAGGAGRRCWCWRAVLVLGCCWFR
jgi:hypothetical protein